MIDTSNTPLNQTPKTLNTVGVDIPANIDSGHDSQHKERRDSWSGYPRLCPGDSP